MAGPVPTMCNHCGQWDTDPKSNWFPEGTSFHHNCLPADKKAQLVESNPKVIPIIEASEAGVRGDELRALILDLHKEDNS